MDAYAGSFLGLMVLAAIILAHSPVLGAGKGRAAVTPGEAPKGGYDNLLYRIDRSHQNATENFALFAVPVLAAMALGVGAGLLSALVWIHVVLRLAYLVLYLRKVGAAYGGIRSITYALGWLVNVIVVLVVAWTALGAM